MSDTTLSELVDDAVRAALAEDAADVAAAEARRSEPPIPFDEAVRQLQARGRI